MDGRIAVMKPAAGQRLKTAASLALCVLAAGAALWTLAPAASRAQQATSTEGTERPEKWEIIAAGRVEPISGEIKIAAAIIARVADVPVRAGDKVFAGELLLRLDDDEARARVASAQAQVALRKRARNDVGASGRGVLKPSRDCASANDLSYRCARS